MRLESAAFFSPARPNTWQLSLKRSLSVIELRSPRCMSRFLAVHLEETDKDRIESEFSGHMRDGLMYLVQGAEAEGQGINRDAQFIEAAMSGMGTKDERMWVSLLARLDSFCGRLADVWYADAG
jgi:hypothetical protein